jgi:hypothetical protein
LICSQTFAQNKIEALFAITESDENGKVTAPQMRVCANSAVYQRRLSVRRSCTHLSSDAPKRNVCECAWCRDGFLQSLSSQRERKREEMRDLENPITFSAAGLTQTQPNIFICGIKPPLNTRRNSKTLYNTHCNMHKPSSLFCYHFSISKKQQLSTSRADVKRSVSL